MAVNVHPSHHHLSCSSLIHRTAAVPVLAPSQVAQGNNITSCYPKRLAKSLKVHVPLVSHRVDAAPFDRTEEMMETSGFAEGITSHSLVMRVVISASGAFVAVGDALSRL